ncbi:putative bifunctional diguanylate cyclase/phosphodiesterase [Marinicrinis lubricantis]
MKAAVIYGLFGVMYIAFSDYALEWFGITHDSVHRLQSIKGWVFITATAILMYILIRKSMLRRYMDENTGLPNRQLFKANWKSKFVDGRKVTLLLINIDRFKQMNDAFGEETADQLLRETAQRMKGQISMGMKLFKIYADEFAILIEKEIGLQDLQQLCNMLIDQFQKPLLIGHYEIYAHIRIGASLSKSHCSLEELHQQANYALQIAKRDGKELQFFSPEIKSYREQLLLENEMQSALQNEHFEVHYQPQYHSATSSMIGLEALLRWKHPDKGWISPGEFIPLAEESGLIVPLGEWTIRKVCEQIKEWQEHGLEVPKIAINLSLKQLLHTNFPKRVLEIIHQEQLNPCALEFEITESVAIDMDHAAEAIRSLKESGFSISMDDFGTGYSSLNALHKLPVDKLKIDRSFVQNILNDEQKAGILKTIIDLTKHLDMMVIAEGVEKQDEVQFLMQNGCEYIQGYVYSKPLPPMELAKRVQFEMIRKKAP